MLPFLFHSAPGNQTLPTYSQTNTAWTNFLESPPSQGHPLQAPPMFSLVLNDILNDNISLYKGIIAENYVANQLISNGHNLYYWKNNNTAEIDFLLYTQDGIIPIEVKGGNNTQAKSLNIYNNIFKPKYSIRIR